MRGPKIRFTAETILLKTYEFIDEFGLDALNTRSLAEYIGCSTQPIFRLFTTMEDLLNQTYNLIEKKYDAVMEEELKNNNIPFLGMGLGYIRFASEHPNLFKALFMAEHFQKESMIAFFQNEESNAIIEMIAAQTQLTEENARKLLRNIWLLTHGIATMIAYNEVSYSETEILEILGTGFKGFQTQLKEKNNE